MNGQKPAPDPRHRLAGGDEATSADLGAAVASDRITDQHLGSNLSADPASNQFGRFTLLALIADYRGVQTYAAVHEHLRKHVKLKLLPDRSEWGDRQMTSFASDMSRRCELDHPNLARLETAGMIDRPYIVIEHPDGIVLRNLLHRSAPLPVADACQIAGQVASAVAYLHENRLVHGGITLDEVEVTASGAAKLTPFGSVRASETLESGFESDLQEVLALLRSMLGVDHSDQTGPESNPARNLPRPLQTLLLKDKVCTISATDLLRRLTPLARGCDLPSLLDRASPTTEIAEADAATSSETVGYLKQQLEERSRSSKAEPATVRRRAVMIGTAMAALLVLVGLGALLIPARSQPTFRLAGRNPHIEPASPPTRDVPDQESKDQPSSSIQNESRPQIPAASDLSRFPLDVIVPERDAFDLETQPIPEGLILSNPDARGLIQIPVLLPNVYSLEFTAERISGSGSLGVGFSAGNARMIAILDHGDPQDRRSGFLSTDARGELTMLDESSGGQIDHGRPERFRLEVNPQRASLMRVRSRTTSVPIAEWRRPTGDGATSDRLRLKRFDGFYPRVFFVQVDRASFRISQFEMSGRNGPVRLQSFANGSGSTENSGSTERQLAERIVWRGGHVRILTDKGPDTVHSLSDLTDNPWLVGMDKCPASPRLAIGDSVLRQLAEIPGIEELDLRTSDVTSQGLEVINGMLSLKNLAVQPSAESRLSLEGLGVLPSLRKLTLAGAQLSPDDRLVVRRQTKLTYLCLAGSSITDAEVIELVQHLPDLQHLCLIGTSIDGSCLRSFSGLRQLRELQLSHTKVTDTDLERVAMLDSLRLLAIRNTQITPKAIGDLQRARPELKVIQ
ncbi:protein kinase [Roseiconus nitratireducens]|uniref:Protein kinase n=1 Tax=Roseiconus nitratireducens TaxID=2605748 RepID=A0A5M6D1X0_9BACT|nr:protein kinase [Roseiconus nitratireducens]KAA5541448.1 protein kinase [Roseiconus nitratireducens]